MTEPEPDHDEEVNGLLAQVADLQAENDKIGEELAQALARLRAAEQDRDEAIALLRATSRGGLTPQQWNRMNALLGRFPEKEADHG